MNKTKQIMAKATVSKEEHPEFGQIFRLEHSDGVKIYITKRGLNVSVPKNKYWTKGWNDKKRKYFEINISPKEIDLLLRAVKWAYKIA